MAKDKTLIGFQKRAAAFFPPLRPWMPAIEAATVQITLTALKVPFIRRLTQAAADERGQSVVTQELVATAIGVALTLLVLGVIIWRAVVSLGNKTAADIESAGNWAP